MRDLTENYLDEVNQEEYERDMEKLRKWAERHPDMWETKGGQTEQQAKDYQAEMDMFDDIQQFKRD